MQLMTVALREEQETMDKPVFARGRNHRKLLTVGQAAEILSVHPNTIRRWTTRGLLQAYRVGPRETAGSAAPTSSVS